MTKIEVHACTMQLQKNRPMTVLVDRIGYILYFRILATAGATNLLLVTFLIPVSAILLSATVLGEALLPQHVAGMAFIGFGPPQSTGVYGDLRQTRKSDAAAGKEQPGAQYM